MTLHSSNPSILCMLYFRLRILFVIFSLLPLRIFVIVTSNFLSRSITKKKNPSLDTFTFFLSIIISENGPGIPEESMDQVFRPFFRLDQARNAETGGTGLGLSVARDVARGHGGDIYLSKGTQGGLEATVSVPA